MVIDLFGLKLTIKFGSDNFLRYINTVVKSEERKQYGRKA